MKSVSLLPLLVDRASFSVVKCHITVCQPLGLFRSLIWKHKSGNKSSNVLSSSKMKKNVLLHSKIYILWVFSTNIIARIPITFIKFLQEMKKSISMWRSVLLFLCCFYFRFGTEKIWLYFCIFECIKDFNANAKIS